MSGVRAYQTKILIDSLDLSGQTNGIVLNTETTVHEYAVLQNGGQLKLAGLPYGSIEHNGYHSSPAAGQLEYELNARLGSSSAIVVAAIFGTSLAIPIGYVLPTTFGQQLKVKAAIAGLIEVAGMWPAKSDNLIRGYQVHYGVISATGATSTIDFAAAAAGAGSKAYLFVQAKTGTITNAAVTVQSSAASNFASPTDRGTFTFSGLGAFAIALTGTLGRYVRLNCTDLGGATDFTVLGVVCSFGNTF
jgi:hypothetical protein